MGTTGRRCVLRKDWSARTVRAVIISSSDGTASLPSLTQVDGVTWEIPLASFTITTAGVIAALTDEREYVDYFQGKDFQVSLGVSRWSLPGIEFIGTTSGSPTTDIIKYTPILIPRTMTFDRIGINVNSAGGGGEKARLGVYAARREADGLHPGRLILDAGQISVDGTGDKEATISLTLTPGYYFLAFVDSSTANYTYPNIQAAGIPISVIGHRTSLNDTSVILGGITGVIASGPTANGLPDPAPAITNVGSPNGVPMLRDTS